MLVNQDPTWFITGCSSGFGLELARCLLERGINTIVTARDTSSVSQLIAEYPNHAMPLSVDVTNDEDVRRAVDVSEAMFGGIDVLVNNAGYAYLSAVEEGEDEDIRAMFDVNFFGLARVTRAVLPGMRRRHSGHIINISSIAGICGLPSGGYYSATKFAVEGFSEALTTEVKPLGIDVTVVEPSGFRTDFAGRSMRVARKEIHDYRDTALARRTQIARSHGRQPGDPRRLAEAIINIGGHANPPEKLLLGKTAFEIASSKYSNMLSIANAAKNISISVDQPVASEVAAE